MTSKFTPPKERFLQKIDKSDPNGCWIWKGAKRGLYGLITLSKGNKVAAHRFSWEFHNNKSIPSGMCVCHTCDVPLCVNPAHLFLGTMKDNMDDKVRKGRWSYGFQHSENHGEAILTNAKVKEIIQKLKTGVTRRAIADEYGVHNTTISAIACGRTWKRIPRE